MTGTPQGALTIDVLIVSDRWKQSAKAKSVVRRAVSRAAAATLATTGAELAIVLTDDSAIRLLNRDWRGVDAATNVLSFPARNGHGHLGDIILAFETIAREAQSERKPFAHHVAHLAVHGFLHLLGYDHDRDDDAQAMERAEREILRQLAIPDPYRPQLEKPHRAAARNSARKLGKKRDKNPAKKPFKKSAKKSGKKSVTRPAAQSPQKRPKDAGAEPATLAAKRSAEHHGGRFRGTRNSSRLVSVS
jgi:probable rRNA maturation factor